MMAGIVFRCDTVLSSCIVQLHLIIIIIKMLLRKLLKMVIGHNSKYIYETHLFCC